MCSLIMTKRIICPGRFFRFRLKCHFSFFGCRHASIWDFNPFGVRWWPPFFGRTYVFKSTFQFQLAKAGAPNGRSVPPRRSRRSRASALANWNWNLDLKTYVRPKNGGQQRTPNGYVCNPDPSEIRIHHYLYPSFQIPHYLLSLFVKCARGTAKSWALDT